MREIHARVVVRNVVCNEILDTLNKHDRVSMYVYINQIIAFILISRPQMTMLLNYPAKTLNITM